MEFNDRHAAGKLLGERLAGYRDSDSVVLGLPRGGIAVAYEVARSLRLPLGIVVPRKVGHLYNPEYAICAVTKDGTRVCNEDAVDTVDHAWLERACEREVQEARRRYDLYTRNRPNPSVRGVTALVVDDGIATGLTMRAALASVQQERPERIVVAVPVLPVEVAAQLRRQGHEIVALIEADSFVGAVGAYYRSFAQVEDEEVIALLGGH